MKKFALLLTTLFVSQAAFAYIQEYTTSDIKTLQGTGYSQSTLKVVDTERTLKQGYNKDYVPYYDRRAYSSNPIVKWYQMAKRLVDPGTDDNFFGVHEIQMENTIHELYPTYASWETPNDKYNRFMSDDVMRLDTAGKTIKGSNGVEPTYYYNTRSDYYMNENL